MSLEEKYLNAAEGTYVHTVKTRQAVSTVPSDGTELVNYMDGERRSPRTDGVADTFQKEFKRHEAGANIRGGSQGTVPPSNDKAYTLSRWTDRALKLAFDADGEGPSSLTDGFYGDNRFRKAINPHGTTEEVHQWNPSNTYAGPNGVQEAAFRVNSGPIGTVRI